MTLFSVNLHSSQHLPWHLCGRELQILCPHHRCLSELIVVRAANRSVPYFWLLCFRQSAESTWDRNDRTKFTLFIISIVFSVIFWLRHFKASPRNWHSAVQYQKSTQQSLRYEPPMLLHFSRLNLLLKAIHRTFSLKSRAKDRAYSVSEFFLLSVQDSSAPWCLKRAGGSFLPLPPQLCPPTATHSLTFQGVGITVMTQALPARTVIMLVRAGRGRPPGMHSLCSRQVVVHRQLLSPDMAQAEVTLRHSAPRGVVLAARPWQASPPAPAAPLSGAGGRAPPAKG